MADFTIKLGDTRPALIAQLEDNGVPIDLTNAESVTFLMRLQGALIASVNAACMFVDREFGQVVYTWTEPDTDTVGVYDVEFEIIWNDGGIETVPNDTPAGHKTAYYTVEIKQDLGTTGGEVQMFFGQAFGDIPDIPNSPTPTPSSAARWSPTPSGN